MKFRDYVKREMKKRKVSADDIAWELGIGHSTMYDLLRVPPKGEIGVVPSKKVMPRIIKWSDHKVLPNDWYGL